MLIFQNVFYFVFLFRMAAITLSSLQDSLEKIQNQPLSKSDIYLISLLAKILQIHPILSVSFINSQLKGKNKNISISFKFLEKYASKFGLGIIGSDLKIWQKQNIPVDASFDEHDGFYLTLDQILKKDNGCYIQLKKRLNEVNGFAPFSEIMEWSSNKFKYNLPFILRNSHKFELFMENDITYVKLNEIHQKNTRIDKDENMIWQLVQSNVKDLVADSLESFLMKVDHPVNQGTLQVCVDYGFQAIDKSFMQHNSNTFVGGGDRGIAIKGSKAAQLVGASNLYVSSPPRSSSSSFFAQSETLSTTPCSVFPPSPAKREQYTSNRSLSSSMESRIAEGYGNNQVVVIPGGVDKPPIFVWDENTSKVKEQLQMLTALKHQIDSEIARISFQK
jgi:hypothetical protein